METRLTHDGLPPGFLLRTEPDNLSDIVLEPLIQHSIGFVQDEVLYATGSRSSFDQVATDQRQSLKTRIT